MRFNIITLGCSKNTYDSQVIAGKLSNKRENEVVYQQEAQKGDTVIINTCGFIQDAKQQSINTILSYIELKKKKQIAKLIVTGCLSQRYREEINTALPQIDEIYGVGQIDQLVEKNIDYKKELVGESLLATPKHYAYLKISEGCNRPCSFCAIPLIRGKHLSRPIELLVREAEQLAQQGVVELILIAQDLTYYGLDIYKKRSLSTLLKRLVKIKGIQWIRLHYAFPSGFPLDVLETIREEPKVCNYIDIPLQHINDTILTSMKRGINKQRTNSLLDNIRSQIPNVVIRTTLIVGYPLETQERFEELYQWVRQQQFDRLGCFTYSHEKNTSAYHLDDGVGEPIKKERLKAIMSLQEDISLKKNISKVGQTLQVLIDGYEQGYAVGRTEFDSPEVDNEVLIKNSRPMQLGKHYPIKITECQSYDLYGEIA